MAEHVYPKVQAYQATTEVPNGPPPINWKEVDNFDPQWLVAIGYLFGALLIARITLSILGLYLTCVLGWVGMTIASYGWAGFMINPFYCIIMSFLAGSVTYIVLIVFSEAFNAPGRIWWKITR